MIVALDQHEIAIGDVNWLGAKPLSEEPQAVYARIRSTRAPVPATIRATENGVVLVVSGGETGVSPGQAAVFYEGQGSGQRVLGGGFIALKQRPRVEFARSATVALSA